MLIQRLSEAFGVSGNEEEVRNLILEEAKPYINHYWIDALGNLIVYKGPKEGKEANLPKIMLAAHMDEIGFMISHIENNGLLRFEKVGGIDDRILPSKEVIVGKEKIPGVIGLKAIHLQKPHERQQVMSSDQLLIDIGARSKEQAEKLVKIGDYATFTPRFSDFGKDLLKGKSFDDRVGCAVLLELLKEDLPVHLYAAFTVQEEIGLRGAGVAAYRINPDYAFTVEGTTCADIPVSEEHNKVTRLGRGPAISFMDRTSIADRDLVRTMIQQAEEHNIPYQWRETTFGGNDAGRIHTTREGIKTASIAVPARYIHSPQSVINVNDFNNTVKLLSYTLTRIGKGGIVK